MPCVVRDWTNTKTVDPTGTRAYKMAKETVEAIFTPLSSFTRTETETKIMKFQKVSESTASRRVNDYKHWELIEMGTTDGKYRRCK